MVEPDPKRTTNAEALANFAGNGSPEERKIALTVLIASKFLPKHAEDLMIIAGRDQLLRDAVNHPDAASQLLAIAESIRLAQVVKRWLPQVTRSLEPAFINEPPSLSLLTDADDRLNAARACALFFERSWQPNYIARSIAEEEQGEKARTELVNALLLRSPSLTSAFQILAKHFVQVRPTTEAPGDSLAKRLTRTLSALRSAVVESDCDAGDDLGNSLAKLITSPLAAVGKPQDEKSQIELSREVILCVHDIVRTRLSVVADPAMYLVVAYCRRLCQGTWPNELGKPLERLVTDVSEALILLGRRGQCDQQLLEQLDVLFKYPERARSVAKELAVRHPELPEHVRDWLERGRIRPSRVASSAALDAAANNADAAIGLALQAGRQARAVSESLRDRLLSSLEIYEPSLMAVTEDCMNQLRMLVVQVEQAASLRGLELFGTPGDETDAATKFFETIGDSPRQRMIVRQPAIVKIRADGTPGDVVQKGLAE